VISRKSTDCGRSLTKVHFGRETFLTYVEEEKKERGVEGRSDGGEEGRRERGEVSERWQSERVGGRGKPSPLLPSLTCKKPPSSSIRFCIIQ